MRVRLESDAEVVEHFLKVHNYPHPWSATSLREFCIIMRIEDGPIIVGYVWASWADEGLLDFHVCVRRSHRGQWAQPNVIADLLQVAELTGAKAIKTTTPDARSARLVGALLTRRFGFRRISENTVIKELTDGHVQQAVDATGVRSSGA